VSQKKEPASLAAIKLRRGPRRAQTSNKAGDITAHLSPQMASPPPAAPLPPPLVDCSPAPIEAATTVPELDLLPTPQPARPAQAEIQTAAARAKEPEYWEFIDYWNRLRRDRPLPALTLLDRELVADCWPDSLMVTYPTADAPMPQIARLSKATGEIEYTPMVTDWIISCAREVARHGEAMEDEQEFPLAGGTTGYRLLLLPFAGAQGDSDHVLCHLSRARKDRAPRL
jgi:hypothetical protein